MGFNLQLLCNLISNQIIITNLQQPRTILLLFGEAKTEVDLGKSMISKELKLLQRRRTCCHKFQHQETGNSWFYWSKTDLGSSSCGSRSANGSRKLPSGSREYYCKNIIAVITNVSLPANKMGPLYDSLL